MICTVHRCPFTETPQGKLWKRDQQKAPEPSSVHQEIMREGRVNIDWLNWSIS